MIEELLNPFAVFIREFGFPVVTIMALLALTFMVFRTRTRTQDEQTRIQTNANEAQKIINARVTVLETTKDAQQAQIDRLEKDLAARTWELNNARLEIVELQKQLAAVQADKTALATERDKLNADLASAQQRIGELEREMFKLQAQLAAEKDVQEKVVNPLLQILKDSLPPRTGDTDKLNLANARDTDPALETKGDEA